MHVATSPAFKQNAAPTAVNKPAARTPVFHSP